MGNLVKKMKKAIIKQEDDLMTKEQILKKEMLNIKYIEAKSKLKEDELNKKVEFQNKILQDLEDKEELLNQNQKTVQGDKAILEEKRDNLNCKQIDLEKREEQIEKRKCFQDRKDEYLFE